jgi:MFS family permease
VRRPFLTAMLIDAVGSGVYLPFTVYYFTSAHAIPLGLVGAAIALANAAMIPFSAGLGAVVDRLGPRDALIAGNLLRAAVLALYPLGHRPAVAMALLAASAVLDKCCWVSQAALIGGMAPAGESRTLFSTVGWARNLGLGAGSAAGGLAASAWGTVGLNGLVLANAASCAVAAAILLRCVVAGTGRPRPGAGRGALAGLGRDRGFLALVAAKFCFVVCAIAVANFLPYYLITSAGLPPWTAGLALTVNSGLIIAGQRQLTRRLSTVARTRLLAAGGGAYAAGGLLFGLAGQAPMLAAIACAGAGMVIYTLGEIVIAPSSDSLAADLAPPAAMGRYMSVYQVGWSIGAVVVPGGGAVLLGSFAGWFWAVFGVTAVAGAAISLRVGEPAPAGLAGRHAAPAAGALLRRGGGVGRHRAVAASRELVDR